MGNGVREGNGRVARAVSVFRAVERRRFWELFKVSGEL